MEDVKIRDFNKAANLVVEPIKLKRDTMNVYKGGLSMHHRPSERHHAETCQPYWHCIL